MGESLFISSRATIRRQIVSFPQSSRISFFFIHFFSFLFFKKKKKKTIFLKRLFSDVVKVIALWMTKMMTTIEDNNKGTTFVWPLDSSLSTNPSVKSTIKKPLCFLSKTSRLHSRSMTAELKETPKLKLYSYWRSSCSQRVRIGLNLKGLEYEYKAVDLLKGEQFTPEFEKLNPLKYVPVLVDGDVTVSDSFAILLYLEDKYPEHPLLPKDLQKKALNIQAASIVGSSIQPLRTLTFLNYIEEKISTDEKLAWLRGHLSKGFAALEKLLKGCAGRYATGDEVQLADVFLAPQIEGGITRFQLDMSPFPTLARLHEAYCEHPAFQASQPNRQPDSPSSS